MKKLIAGLFAAILTTAGLVAVTSATPASAACTAYVCNATTAKGKAPKSLTAGKPAKVRISVTSRGTVEASGIVTVVVTGPGGFKKTINVNVSGGDSTAINLGKLTDPGSYKVKITYKGDSGFRDSTARTTIKVKKKK
jgi:hypothetical protein